MYCGGQTLLFAATGGQAKERDGQLPSSLYVKEALFQLHITTVFKIDLAKDLIADFDFSPSINTPKIVQKFALASSNQSFLGTTISARYTMNALR